MQAPCHKNRKRNRTRTNQHGRNYNHLNLRFTKPIFINNDEFLVCPAKHHRCEGDGIWKYNIKQHEWIKIADFETSTQIYSHSTALDPHNNCVYIFRTINGNQMKLDLNTQNSVS